MTVTWNQLQSKLKTSGKLNGPKEAILRQVKLSGIMASDAGLTAKLAVDSSLSASMIERFLMSEIRSAFVELTGIPTQIELEVLSRQEAFPLESIAPDLLEEAEPPEPMTHFSTVRFKDRMALDPQLNFDSLIETAENRFGRISMREFAENTELGFSVVAIHGPSGVGKSHLLHAAGLRARELQPALRVKIVTGDEFITDFQSAISKKNMGDFRRRYRLETDFLLVDDLHSISRAKATQEEFFNLMNHIAGTGRRLAITCDRPIHSLEGLESRIQSRLSGGLVVSVQHPSEPSRRLILSRKLAARGVALEDDQLARIVACAGPCVRSLEGIVNTLAMLRRTQSLNQEVLAQVLGASQFLQSVPPARKSPDEIMNDVAKRHRLSLEDLRGRSRSRMHVVARRESMRRLQNELGLSVSEIGRLHQRNHATVLSALRG